MVAPTSVVTPWSTARPYIATLPSWMPDPLDQERIASYALYQNIYDSVPDTFKITQRGSDSQPIYLPNAKTIVESTNRYLAISPEFYCDPTVGSPKDRADVIAQMKILWKREQMYAKIATQKRYGLIRGDAVWHLVADPTKPPGARISIYEVDPAAYFPIEDPDIPGRVVGCHLVSQTVDSKGTTTIRRRTYRKEAGGVSSELTYWEVAKWDDRDATRELKRVLGGTPKFMLPPLITSLPVYHIKNSRQPESLFGASELKGIERVLGAVNQAISDEELTLAMQGLGVYWTNSGPPVDDAGNETNWNIGPARVVEVEGDATFGRVNGVASVDAPIQHMNFILDNTYEAVALPDVARGRVDVAVAESGIALALKLSPLLAKNGEKEAEMLPVYDNMMFDIVNTWFPAYESMSFGDVNVGITVGDPMPVNRKARVDEVLAMLAAKLVTAQWARDELTKYGYVFPAGMDTQIVNETTALSNANAGDSFANRINSELP